MLAGECLRAGRHADVVTSGGMEVLYEKCDGSQQVRRIHWLCVTGLILWSEKTQQLLGLPFIQSFPVERTFLS